jgi:hypothetical protein
MNIIKNFLREENMPYECPHRGSVDVRDEEVRENINSMLMRVTNGKFLTAHIALEKVSKVLANFHIFIPKQGLLEGDDGNIVVPIDQYGEKFGARDDGTVVTAPESDYCLYFEYLVSDCGMFDVFAHIVDKVELDEILDDLEEEANEEEDDELNESKKSDDDKASIALRKTVAKWKLKDAMKPTRPGYVKKHSQAWYEKMTKRANEKIDEENLQELDKKTYKSIKNVLKKRIAMLNRGLKDRPESGPLSNAKDRHEKSVDRVDRLIARKETNTVSESNHENKMKKKFKILHIGGEEGEKPNVAVSSKAVRKARQKIKGPTVNQFDIRNLKFAEETIDEVSAEKVGEVNAKRMFKPAKTEAARKTLAKKVNQKWLESNVGKLKE